MKLLPNRSIVTLAVALTATNATAQLNWDVEIGLGYNSNIYQTPSESYIDISQTPAVSVNPSVKSGLYIPLNVGVDYEKMLISDTLALKADYRLITHRYLNRDYSNGDKTVHRIDLGGEYIFKQVKSRKDSLYAGIFAKNVEEYYVDRDSGEMKLAPGAIDVSERYYYDSVGFELEYKYKTGAIQYGLSWLVEKLDYVDPIVVSQYDNDYQKLAAEIEFRLAKPTKLYLDISKANRAYDERPSRDLNGSMFASYPAREYDYQTVETTLRHKFSKTWVSYLTYKYSTRKDLYVGYNDYTGHTIKARLLHKTETVRTRLAVSYKTLNYDNALAFEELTGGKKSYDAVEASISTELPQSEQRALWGELKYNAVDTNDSRYKYDRYKVALGYKWEY